MARIEFQQIGYDAEGEPQYGIPEVLHPGTIVTHKKHPLLKEICDLLGYKNRRHVVHVVPTDEVKLLNVQWTNNTRVRYRAVNIQTIEIIPLPPMEGAIVRLNLAMAVAASIILDGREQPLTIYIRPENIRAVWSQK